MIMKKTICIFVALLMIIMPTMVYAQQKPDMLELEYAELSYNDDGTEIFSRQKVFNGITQVSSVVPQRVGKIFCGWQVEGKKVVYKPGQLIEMKSDTVLDAQWENGYLPELKLKAESALDGSVTFSLDFSYGGLMNYAYFEVHTRNLTTTEENVFEITNGTVTVEGLMEGQYKATLVAKKYDIEYFSDEVNFVVLSGVSAPDAPLKLVMDGKELIFADEQPQLIGSYTYIAIRQFCESMDAKVVWRDEDRSATITLGGTIIKVYENTDQCVVNGTVQSLPVTTIIKNGRMLLPLRSVAEFCNAEIVWDDNRTVYIYRGAGNVFEENMMFVKTSSKMYLGTDGEELNLSRNADYDCGWIFDAADGANGIYTIYSIADTEKALQVRESVIVGKNDVVLDKVGNFDGHLWRLNRNNDGTYTISPANNSDLYLDLEGMTLTYDAAVYEINYISSLEL